MFLLNKLMGSIFTTLFLWPYAVKSECDYTERACPAGDVNFKQLGRVNFADLAYLSVDKFGQEDFMLLSQMDVGNGACLGIVPGLKTAIQSSDSSSLQAYSLDSSPYTFRSVNKAQKVPSNVFPGEYAILVPDGFLIPGRRDGNVYLMLQEKNDITKTKKTIKLAEDIPNYWYHKGHWVDMNGNGRKDLLIARTNYREGGGRLVWLENPGETALSDTKPWKEHIICSGPDVETSIDFFPQYPNEVVVWAPMAKDKKLAFYRVSTVTGRLVDSRILEDDNGRMKSAQMVDLNGDGKKQLLFNNYEYSASNNGIWAYTIPDDLMTGEFKRYDIATGFQSSWQYFLNRISAPGYPFLFYPNGQK